MQNLNSCSLCGSNSFRMVYNGIRDFEYDAPGSYRWLQCQHCGLVHLDPLPSGDILALAYPPTYHAYSRRKSKITQGLIDRLAKKTAQRYANYLPSGGAVLDIGCASGELLSMIGELGDYRLFGVEYDPESAKIAESSGIHVWVGDVDNADIPKNTMDIVLMQHTLEHVFHPIDTLHQAYQVLKPGGKIFGELPNFDSWDRSLFGRYWGGGHAPRHLHHFTPRTLESALRSSGFSAVRISPSLHTGHWALSLQNWARRNRYDVKGLVSGRTWYYPALLLLTIPVNLIQMLYLKTGVMHFEAAKLP